MSNSIIRDGGNDQDRITPGGVINLEGVAPGQTIGRIRVNGIDLLPAPIGTPDGNVLTVDSMTPNGLSWKPNSGGGVLVATFSLTSAQILALASAPLTVIAAPGAGKVIFPTFIFARSHFVTYRYATPLTFSVGDNEIQENAQIIAVQSNADAFNSDWFYAPGVPLATVANQGFQANQTPQIGSGQIATSTLSDGGMCYAVGDTGVLNGGINDALYAVDTVSHNGSMAIVAVNQGTKYFSVTGDQRAFVGAGGIGGGVSVVVTGSTGNDGTYTLAGAGAYDGTNTNFRVNEAIPSPIGDGNASTDVGAVLTYHITNPGFSYTVGVTGMASGGSQPGFGGGLMIDITAINIGDGSLDVTVYYMILDVS